MRNTLLLLAFASALVAQAESRPSDTAPLIDRWDQWSRDTIEAWRVAKVLHGNDLDKCKRTAAAIAVAWKRCRRAERVEELLDAKRRETFDRLIDAILDGKKKWVKAELEEMKKSFEALIATVTTCKNLLVSIERDLDTMRILCNAKLLDSKGLAEPKRKQLEEHVLQVQLEHDVFVAVNAWDDGFIERAGKAVIAIDELLHALK